MASGKVRCTRKLRSWVVEQLESGKFPGVCWEDEAKTMFRIPWKHAGKQDFREDQDAAFFKAWAIFKGKYKEGDMEGPAIWKTRLRCALNKSTEFEEVPENGHRDGAEPYKVYRLLPPGTLPAPAGTQKSPSKRHHSSVSPEKEPDEGTTKNCILSPSLLQDPLKNEEVGANGGACHSDFGSSSSSSSSSNSPEPQEGADTTEATFQENQAPLEFLPPPDSDYSLLLTFIYSGHVVGEAQVKSLDFRLVAEPSGSQCGMEQVLFPKPGPKEPTQRLLSQLERGVLVASNSQGLFVERLCPIPVSWSAPQTPPGPGLHLLPSNECVALFSTSYFCRDPPTQLMHGTLRLLGAHPVGSYTEPWQLPGSPPSVVQAVEDEAQVEPSTRVSQLGEHRHTDTYSHGKVRLVALSYTHTGSRIHPHIRESWDLAKYFQGLGPPPKFQVTLNFWEENPDPSHTLQSLITVQMEQAFARHLLENQEDQAAILSLVQSLGDPPSSSPLCSPLFSLKETCSPHY